MFKFFVVRRLHADSHISVNVEFKEGAGQELLKKYEQDRIKL